MHAFQLFLDESGDFRETSTDPKERHATRNGRTPSQLAGLLTPTRTLTVALAAEILEEIHAATGLQYGGEFHAKDLDRGTVSTMVETGLDRMAEHQWQPVRLTNREAAVFGDRATTYTNLVAELLLRCFQLLRRTGIEDIGIELHCAGVWDEHRNATFDREDYLPRIREVLTRAAIRAGHGDQQRHWQLTGFVFRSGKRDPELQLCDLLSNASWSDFRKLNVPTREKMREALGDFDLTLQLREDLERLDDLMAIGALGQALVHAAECELAPDRVDRVRSEARRRRDRMVRDLAALGAPARDVQLQTLLTQLEQTIQWQRDLAPGIQLAEWCRTAIVAPLRQALPESQHREVDWFEFAVLLQLLMASNHAGDLNSAANCAIRMRSLQPGIVARWEHLDLFLKAQIHLAVHLTDTRACNDAILIARRVADFHGDLAGMFQAAMPELPDHVRSTRRGEALGTAMQAAMLEGLEDAQQFAVARSFGDEAIEEFDSAADRARHAQYRCQLETFAGNFDQAREWLVKALGCASDHAAISEAIAKTDAGSSARGFWLLHWLRFGARAFATLSARREAESFASAWQETELANDPWCRGERDQHPAPSILRYRGEIALALGDNPTADFALNCLRKQGVPMLRARPLLALPMLALWSQQVAHAAEHDAARLRNLLQDRGEAPGLITAIAAVAQGLQSWPGWERVMRGWQEAAERMDRSPGGADARTSLRAIADRTLF